MKLEVLQENLSKAVSIASRFASTKAQLPVLGNILLSAGKNKLLVCSTNLEISVAVSIGAKVERSGDVTIPGRVISELVANLTPGTLKLSSEKEILEISAPNFSSNVSGMNASDFPTIPHSLEKASYSFPREKFLTSLSQVSFSASQDETRPILTGILLLFKKGEATLVATDGFRLSQKKITLKGVGKIKSVVLPKNALMEASRLVAEGEILFSFSDQESQVILDLGQVVMSSRVLQGEFPDFEKIIPKESITRVNVDKEDFLRAVKLASVFARDSANIVNFTLKKDGVLVSGESQSSGRQESTIEAKVEGFPQAGFEIAFNYRFLEEFLHSVEGEGVSIGLSSENSPGVFTDPSDPDYLHLIMPVRIQS